ncbi:MMPL family transporter [Brevibacterium yomogidense]
MLLPALLVLVWLAGAGVGGPYFGKVDEVSSNDRTAYLPESSEATVVQNRQGDFTEDDALPAVVVFVSEDTLDDEDLAAIAEAVDTAVDAVPSVIDGASPPIPSEDGVAAQAFIPLDADADTGEAVTALDEALTAEVPAGIDVLVTGPAGFSADLAAGFAGIDGLLLIVALSAVFVILLLVYRSALLPFAVLGTSMFALCVALLTVWWLAKAGVLLLSGQTQGILFILVIGAATDYALLVTARAREALTRTLSVWDAVREAVRGSVEPILASGGTVIAGLLCLLLSDLKSNSSLGPVAAIGILFAMASALTFLPAVLTLMGRAAFWPRVPRFVDATESAAQSTTDQSDTDHSTTDHSGRLRPRTGRAASRIRVLYADAGDRSAARETRHSHRPAVDLGHGVWAASARLVSRRSRTVWIATTVVLIIGAAFVPQLKADGVPQSDLVLGASDAREGQNRLGEHFPAGAGSPLYVLVDESDAATAARALHDEDDIDSVSVASADAPAGTLPITADGDVEQPAGGPGGAAGDESDGTPDGAPDGAPEGAMEAPLEPTVSDGQVLLEATLTVAPDSTSAEQVVRDVRADLHDSAGSAMVGGVTATAVDTNDTAVHDRNLIIPVILVVILVILMLLLRAVLAPVLLILTTVLSFGTAMGVSALVFNHVFDFPGADPAVPLYGFVFLVALGIDYNIFLMTRVREETLHHGTRDGVLRGLVVTGGVITSAGVVLAATFAALSVIPILFLAQLAFIVAFGVLLDTFVVRTLLVPALVYDVGPRVWWPGRPDRTAKTS